MPTPTTNKYYSSLSNVISLDDFPESLGFIKEGIQSIFNSIFIKDYQSYIGPRGDSGFYSLSIVSKKRLQFEVPGTGIFLILNPDAVDNAISSFPVTVEYEWLILSYLRSFNLDNFSFSAKEFFDLGLDILNVSEEDVVAVTINNFVVPANETISKLEQFVQNVNTKLGLSIPTPSTDNKVLELTQAIIAQSGDAASLAIFAVYFFEDSDVDTLEKVKLFFNFFLPDNIETYIKKLITPKARVTLALSAAIEFPEKILKPVTQEGVPISAIKTKFQFAQALLYADTEAGIGYELELAGSLMPPFAEIGNTGLLLQIESLKLDLSKKINIPEADADGRPADFTGVYARALSVTLPSKWFHNDIEGAGSSATTLRLGGYDLLIGTGGVSGTIMLESVPVATGNGFQYYNDKFSFIYPIVMFEKDSHTKKIKEKNISSYTVLRSYLMSLNSNAPYAFKYPLSLKPAGTTDILTFNTAPEYQIFLASLNNNTLWKKIGSNNGFRVGFNSFDITFKQNKIISSNISGALEIKKFVYPQDHPTSSGQIVKINILGHIDETGGFNLTASAQPYPIVLPEVFTYNLKSVELGREGDGDFYIGTSGTLQFDGILKELLNIGSIEIERLRIYSDGSIDFQGGGTINLIKPIVLPLGPVNITVTAMHYGSHQKEINGEMRKFNFFGFDGALKVDPLGVEIRGDGVKYYYCTEDSSLNYLHIETLHLDLTIPAKTPVAIINGWLSIPEPGVSEEYGGGVKIQLPKAKIAGSADMKLAPKYPAFIIDTSIDFSVPIPLGTFAIYGFSGLLGYRYVAEKEAIGLVSGVDTWYDYYKKPQRGINVQKFSGPDKTTRYSDPFSIGAGASLGTSFDNGTVLNIKAMLLLSIPSLFMIDGRAALISARLGLEETKDPPFFAMLAIGDNSIEFGFGADFKMPTKSGYILQLYADVQAAFFFNNTSNWYVNIGTRINPVSAKIIDLVTIQSYVMLSAKGIEAGARGELDFERTYARIIKVKAWAYIEIGGKISFERPQFGSYLDAGIGAVINVKVVELSAAFQVLFAVEASEPFRIYGQARIKIYITIGWVFKLRFNQDVDILWEKDSKVNKDPINPLLVSNNTDIVAQIVQGVNMLSNETFELAYLDEGLPVNLDPRILEKIIPLDTYIDIKAEKGFLPGAIGNLIGGVTNAPTGYTDLIPPDKNIKGKSLRQVKHQYSVESIEIKAWRQAFPAQNNQPAIVEGWIDYNPYKALYPNDSTGILDTLKVGQYQKTDGVYNTIRILGTTPFSYTEQGQPGWFIPEQYGLTSGTLFCETDRRILRYANFLNKSLGQQYFCLDDNQMFYSNNVSFFLNDQQYGEFGQVTNDNNSFNFVKSLSFYNHNSLDIFLPAPSVYATLKLSSNSQGLMIKYYSILADDYALQTQYCNPNPSATNQGEPYTKIINISQLEHEIIYNNPSWRPIIKIVVEPLYPNPGLIAELTEQIGAINNLNDLIALGMAPGQPQSADALIEELEQVNSTDGGIFVTGFTYNYSSNQYKVNTSSTWLSSWNTATGHKYPNNPFGFKVFGNIITIESDHQIIKVKLSPQLTADFYTVDYRGKTAVIYLHDINDYINVNNPGLHFNITYYDSGCSSDTVLCEFYESISEVYSNCLLNPLMINNSQLQTLKNCLISFTQKSHTFNTQHPSYEVYDNMTDQFDLIETFKIDLTIANYAFAYDAVIDILDYVNTLGVCYCRNCNKDYLLCDLSDELQTIVDNCLTKPSNTNPNTLPSLAGCIRDFTDLIYDFDREYISYNLAKGHLQSQLFSMGTFINSISMSTYNAAYNAALTSISIIRDLGNCDCGGDDTTSLVNKTLFHEIGWLSLEDYEFNMNIPSIEAITEDVQATINGITKYIQPVWRPSTSYYIHFVLRDTVDVDNIITFKDFPFTYGFTTAGPIGYFHKAPASTYGDIKLKEGQTVDGITIQTPSVLDDPNGILRYADGTLYPPEINEKVKPHPDSYPLTSLKQYIDYERSYPNADGNLLISKPLFYDDSTTQIYLYYNKAYASNFFTNWQNYMDMRPINGRIKVVIKDPIEGTEIINPPYLDYNENDTTTINIPQTIEEWHTDIHPMIPFVLSQWTNLYTANNCVVLGADPVKPASKFTIVKLKNLKPSKLYTAIVNNLYGPNDPDFSETTSTTEVHKFVFKTSRYANFAEQVNSYILSDGTGDNLVTRNAIFNFENGFTGEQVDMAYKTIVGMSNPGDLLINNYQHAYDRIYEGILSMPPLDEAISTEFNIIKKTSNDDINSKVIAVVIRNPEPFNIPKIPLSQINDTIAVLSAGIPDPNYKVLFSKDYSQVIIMHALQEIAAATLDIRFTYKIWDGYAYSISGTPVIVTIDLV